MKYPLLYTPPGHSGDIRIGDLVWWNEGTCIGYVLAIVDQPEQCEAYGLDKPHIDLSNLHPFEANQSKHPLYTGAPWSGGTVIHHEPCFEDEGIGPLSQHEHAELEWAIATARSKVSAAHRDSPFSIQAILDLNRKEEDWVFRFVDDKCNTLETIRFPMRPNTRRPAPYPSS